MEPLVLTVDMAGLPQAWVALEPAITHHAKADGRLVAGPWSASSAAAGSATASGRRIATKSILAIRGTGAGAHPRARASPTPMLFARDRQLCAYCGSASWSATCRATTSSPVSRGGRDSMDNTVTACRSCNTRKAGRSPEQAGNAAALRPTPNRHEHFILRNRRILADQMEYCCSQASPHEPPARPQGLRAARHGRTPAGLGTDRIRSPAPQASGCQPARAAGSPTR